MTRQLLHIKQADRTEPLSGNESPTEQPAAAPQKLSVDELNAIFTPLTFEERMAMLYRYFPETEVLVTSSFGASSVMLLSLVQRFRPTQPVYFLDTTFHFPETLSYKEELTQRFGLNLITLLPDTQRNEISRRLELWNQNPDRCCHYNKVLPLKPLKASHKVWVSGVMGFQTPHRANLRVFEEQEDGLLKFHPLIDINEGELLYYMAYHRLPRHPLEELGYASIGCTHCTAKGQGREGRWQGAGKVECGLHL